MADVIEKSGGKSFIDIVRKFFSPVVSGREEILSMLIGDYSKEIAIAKQMDEHSQIIPYDFLRERLKRIASEERRHAEMLKKKIVELGGQVQVYAYDYRFKSETIHSSRGFRRLISDLEFDREIYEDYIAQLNRVEDEDIRALLERIVIDEIRHKDELTDLVMRLC
jgi:bacterioferritin